LANKNAADILREGADTYLERNAVYKDNYRHIGAVMAGYFPNGITLKTPVDFIRFHLFMLMHVKLTRYTNCWGTGHTDSLVDNSVYSAMLEQVDAEMLRQETEPGNISIFSSISNLAPGRSCACWRTGTFIWVEGCPGHPRESMT
jgi:hypothetical protein